MTPARVDSLQTFVGGLARLGGPDYARHVTRWNDNCVFCHNVAPNPGRDEVSGAFRTEVAEMGIACEACHGPGAAHARANADPVRRYVLHLGGHGDPTIVNPSRLVAGARGRSVRALPRPAHRRSHRSLSRRRRSLRSRRRSGAVERAALAGHADGRGARAVRAALLGRRDRAPDRLRVPGPVAVALHAARDADLHELPRHARRRSARTAAPVRRRRRRLHRLPPRASPRSRRARTTAITARAVAPPPRLLGSPASIVTCRAWCTACSTSIAATASKCPTRRAPPRTGAPMPVPAVTSTRRRRGPRRPCNVGGAAATLLQHQRPMPPGSQPFRDRSANCLRGIPSSARSPPMRWAGLERPPLRPRSRCGPACCWTQWPTTTTQPFATSRPARWDGWSELPALGASESQRGPSRGPPRRLERVRSSLPPSSVVAPDPGRVRRLRDAAVAAAIEIGE